MDIRVAKRYARALFQAAIHGNVVDSVESDLAALNSLIANDKSVRDFFMSPYVAREEKIRIAGNLFSDRITALSMQVVRLMLEKRREAELPEIYGQYVALRRAHQGVQSVTVHSAMEMTEDQKKRLVTRLEEKSGKKIEAEFRVDPSVMGGIKVAYGDYMLDGSIRGSLNRMRDQLRVNLLKQTF